MGLIGTIMAKNSNTKKHLNKTYRSGLEARNIELLDKIPGLKYHYEPPEGKLKYVVPEKVCTYTPDFYITTLGTGKTIIVETKGIWDYEDRFKHYLIRQQHQALDVRFVFTRAKNRISKRSNTTYADICEGNGRPPFKGIKWRYAERTIPVEWLYE